MQQSHPNWQNGIHLPFQYFKTELILELEEEYCSKGWWIMPSKYPCTVIHCILCCSAIQWLIQFLKHLVDDWSHSIPYCYKVKVTAQEGPDTATYINYPVLVRGTTEVGKKVVIQEQLQTSGTLCFAVVIIVLYFCLQCVVKFLCSFGSYGIKL